MKKTTKEGYLKALHAIDPRDLSYEEWLKVGMSLKKEGLTAQDWETWSQEDTDRYHAGECFRKWMGFTQESEGSVTGGTLMALAKENGYQTRPEGRVLTWDDVISAERVIDESWLEEEHITAPASDWDPRADLIRYLESLFDPGDIVGYVSESFQGDDGKYRPAGAGVYVRSAGELITSLKKYPDIKTSIGSYSEEAGGWIRFNPLDGKGVKDENVTAFKYALIESDEISPEKQLAIIRELELPCRAIVSSGNKSIHAIVHIGADNLPEYKKRVDFLFQWCEKNGLRLDKQNKNPSRLSRMPGLMRSGKKQFLIDTKTGKEDFDTWAEWIDDINDDLGSPALPPEDDKPPELAPALIEGILRQGHKMMVAGPSKAGKSFLMMELACAVAMGGLWLGRKVKKGRVLYVNLEIDERSAWNRFWDILQTEGLTYKDLGGNLQMWSLRGKAVPMDKLAGKIIRRAEKAKYTAIILDPIYKVITGDENSASDMAYFTSQFDRVAESLGASFIYAHHHSKGAQGGKKSIDRASGSGVFARDPDAFLDMTQLECPEELRGDYGLLKPSTTAWRVEPNLREFENFATFDLYFDWPRHYPDSEGVLKKLAPAGTSMWGSDVSKELGAKRASERREAKAEEDREDFDRAFQALTSTTGKSYVGVSEMADYFDCTNKTIRNRVNKYAGYVIENGLVEKGK